MAEPEGVVDMPDGIEEERCPELLLRLPAPAAVQVWSRLRGPDRRALYGVSRSSQSVMASCITQRHTLTVTVGPGNQDANTPAVRGLQRLLPSLLQGVACRVTRVQFNPQLISSTFPSGEGAALHMESLEAVLTSQDQDAAAPLLRSIQSLELQGFNLHSTSVPSALAQTCSQLQRLTLSHMDLTGPFFTPFTSPACHTITHITLSNVQLDNEAWQSLDSLGALPLLIHLTLDRLQGLSRAGCPRGHIPGLSSLSHLTSLSLQCHTRCHVKPQLQQVVHQISHLSSLLDLTVHDLDDIQELGPSSAQLLAQSCPRLRRLEFDRHVVITGVRELMALTALTSICTRSLEPTLDKTMPASQEDGSLATADLVPPHLKSLMNLPCSWKHLSLGAFCPSLTALAALPLQTLAEPFFVGELDLGGHPAAAHGDMECVGRAVRAALHNCLKRCPTLTFTAGKLELVGSGYTDPPLRHAAAALQGLELLSQHSDGSSRVADGSAGHGNSVNHIRLVGLAMDEGEVRALGAALGKTVTQVTFGSCSFTLEALHLACDGVSLPHIRQLGFGRHCTGVSLQQLMQCLADRQPSAGQLMVRIVKPVGVQLPSELDPVLVATAVGLSRCKEHLESQGKNTDNVQVILCNNLG